MFGLEHRNEPLLPRRLFIFRMLRQVGYATLVVLPSLVAGAAGFHWTARQSWIDGVLNSAMLLGGMGPVGDLSQAPNAGKVFATIFALYAGLIFLIISGVILTPVFHRVLHHFHIEATKRSSK